MDITGIPAAVSSLKAAIDIAQSLLKMKNMTDVQAKVIELQSALLDAQSGALAATAAQYELLEKVRVLERELQAKTDWEGEKVRYSLVTPWRGMAQAYALRRDAANGEPPHLVCTNCFNNGRRVILNPARDKDGWVQLVCPTCRASVATGYRAIGGPKYAEDYADSGSPEPDGRGV